MSTNVQISARIQRKVKSIYCHWDGYPDHVAPILLKCYNTQKKINKLMNIGNISYLAATPEDCSAYGEKPMITEEWDCSGNYDYWYHWDGNHWLYSYRKRIIKPLSEWDAQERNTVFITLKK